jgi:hypothetical protein
MLYCCIASLGCCILLLLCCIGWCCYDMQMPSQGAVAEPLLWQAANDVRSTMMGVHQMVHVLFQYCRMIQCCNAVRYARCGVLHNCVVLHSRMLQL